MAEVQLTQKTQKTQDPRTGRLESSGKSTGRPARQLTQNTQKTQKTQSPRGLSQLHFRQVTPQLTQDPQPLSLESSESTGRSSGAASNTRRSETRAPWLGGRPGDGLDQASDGYSRPAARP